MYAEVASRTQVQSLIILDPDYLPDYLSVSYDYGFINKYDLHIVSEAALVINLKMLKQISLQQFSPR